MKFGIVILGAPYSTQAPYSAYQFARALINQGHELYRVFLYQDGVQLGTKLACPPQDEFDIYAAWHRLANEHEIDVVTCIAAAARRGIINEEESQRHDKQHANLSEHFSLSGLGQLAEANAVCDRIVTFGT